MKRSLFWLGAAAMALASCTNSEVMEVAENRAIGFSSFVNNNTKAVVPITSTTNFTSANFYVFGEYGNTTSGWTKAGQAFNNELGSAVYYWQPSQTYRFGAYADGANGKIETSGIGATVAFSAAEKKLTFTNYTPNDSKDLVAAISDDITTDATVSSSTNPGPVSLTFKHMLSQVKLTFTTEAAATYQLTITDVKINGAVSTATGTYTTSGASWDGGTANNGYSYEDFKTTTDGTIAISKETPASQVKLVIPQGSTNSLTVTFTATIKGEKPTNSTTLTKNFTATLGHQLNTTPNTGSGISAALADNTWSAGYCYNYTAQIDIEDIVDNATGLVPITFNPSVEDWKDTGNTEVTPQPAS